MKNYNIFYIEESQKNIVLKFNLFFFIVSKGKILWSDIFLFCFFEFDLSLNYTLIIV